MTAGSQSSKKLVSHLFRVGRLLLLALVLVRSFLVLWGLPAAYQKLLNQEPNPGLPGWTQAEMRLTTNTLEFSPQLLAGFLFAASLICLLSFWAIAWLLFWKKGDSVVGLLSFFILTGVGVGFSFLAPDTSRLTGWIKGLYELQATQVWTMFFLLLYLFPNGRFVPRWTRFLAPLPFGLFLLALWYGDGEPGWVGGLALAYVSGGAVSQVYRYKRVSTPEQRQQTKWIVFALALSVMFILASQLIPLLWAPLGQKTTARFFFDIGFNYFLGVLIAALLPVSIGFSIFRYRLYDVDVIIRKTLVYAVLTGLLSLVYFGVVLLLQGLFAGLGAGQSPAAIVLSTLAIAALFAPLRRRVQDMVDRRFYRRKYNAEQALAAFVAAARDEVDVERLSAALVGVIEETAQPQRVFLWIKDPAVLKSQITVSERGHDHGNSF
jgi:hypothetical protein